MTIKNNIPEDRKVNTIEAFDLNSLFHSLSLGSILENMKVLNAASLHLDSMPECFFENDITRFLSLSRY